MRVIAIVFLCTALGGCVQNSNSDPKKAIGATGSAATGDGGAPANQPEFPIVLEVTKEIAEAAQLESAKSEAFDAACAGVRDISAALNSQRPELANGKMGCPRPEGDPSTWSAQ